MDPQSPSLLAAAWLLGPVLVALASLGLGAGMARIARLDLGALTLPAGFAAGIVLLTGLLKVGAGGVLAPVLCAVAAAAGAAGWIAARRSAGGPWRRPAPETLWATGAALAAFAIAMAPLVLAGRSGVLGYVFNNDPAIHLAVVQALEDVGASPGSQLPPSTYAAMAGLLTDGYPIGSHVWPLAAGVWTGVEPFHLWTPAIAVAAAALALVTFAALRMIGAPAPLAGIAAPVVASGYLTYSFVAQGGAKEIVTAVTVYAAVALGVRAAGERGSWRVALPAVVAALAAVASFGVGAGAWLAPPALVAAGWLAWRLRRRRPSRRALALAGAAGAALAVAAVPAAADTLRFVDSGDVTLRDPDVVGNLLGPVPWTEAFNVWLSADYRLDPPSHEALTAIGVGLAAALAAIGAGVALWRRRHLVWLVLLAGAAGAVVISSRYSIYLDAKSYMVLAPALGIATAAGVAALWRGNAAMRVGGVVLGVALAAGVLASDRHVFANAWNTPEERLAEMADIGERFAGRGPMLVNEREEYSGYLLRDAAPWESWGTFQPERGLRAGEGEPPPLPHTPDFDDYTPRHLARFELLLEPRRPGGSRPPAAFEVVHETEHYRVWERRRQPALAHVAVGLGRLGGAAPLNCRTPEVERVLARARRGEGELLVSRPAAAPATAIPPSHWQGHTLSRIPPAPGMINRRGGHATGIAALAPGTYTAWIQGSYGPGVRLTADRGTVGEVFGDLGLPSAWHRLGELRVGERPAELLLTALDKPAWQPGSRQSDITGSLVLEPAGAQPRVERVTASGARALCGQPVDWLELRPGR